MSYCVVTREKMTSEFDGTKRISLKYQPSGVDTVIENGNVVVVGNLIDGEREIYTSSTPAVDSTVASLALITTPEVLADERKKNLSDFRNEAGDVCTGDKLVSGNIFSVTAEGFTGTPAKGKIVELQAGTKLKCVDTLTSGSTQVGTIIDFVNGKYAVQVI
jgi:hypothetical protein